MPEASKQTLQKLYLEASKIDGKPGIYFIGPFGRRVSFASQQQRALNTIWALEKAGKIKEGDDVAVVGGGLAGITAATALLARRCSVWLFEARPRVLNVQDATLHRYVHPTINFWPERPLDATTELPFFDWYADICAPVLGGIRGEWMKYFEEHLSEIYTGTKVIKAEISPSDAITDRATVLLRSTGNGPEEMSFDAVVFATGFGDEVKINGSHNVSYWDEDFLPEKCVGKKILVSGTGDGGLIDALRCVHKKFDRGRLSIELARELHDSSIRKKLIDIESAVQEKAANDPDEASILYATAYAGLIGKLAKGAREFLANSLVSRAEPVRLVGKRPQPYSLSAAPIHKLMIAHAISAGAIGYTQGKLADGPVLKVDGQADEDLSGVLCVARHGATPPLDGILQPSEVKLLRERQQMLADLLEDIPYAQAHWQNWPSYPLRDTESVEFARFRLPMASSFVMKDHGLRVALGALDGKPHYVIGVDPGGATATGHLPSSLFGVPTTVRDAPIIDVFAA